MKITVHDCEIECPDTPHQIALVKGMNQIQANYLRLKQKQPKNWLNHTNIPSYCLYMGSGEIPSDDGSSPDKVDFYHYESHDGSDYSTGIVYGNEGGGYRSGWPELAARRGAYREHLKREFYCGFLTVDDLIRVGIATLGAEKQSYVTIRPMRSNYRIMAEAES